MTERVIKRPLYEKFGPNEKSIKRPSRYGNPFHKGKPHPDTGLPMTRDEVCDLFEERVLPDLDVEALRGKTLVCNCAPERCHGHSIIKKLDETKAAKGEKMTSTPTELAQLGQQAYGHYKTAEKHYEKAEQHYISCGVTLKEAQRICLRTKGLAFRKFLLDHCPVGYSRAYEIIAIADGSKTLKEVRERSNESSKASHAKTRTEAKAYREHVHCSADDWAEKPSKNNGRDKYRGPSEEMAQAINDLLGPEVGEGFKLGKLYKKVSKLVTAIEHPSTDPIRKEQLQHQLDKMNARYGSYLVGKCAENWQQSLKNVEATRNSLNVDREYISEKLAEFALDETYDLAWRKAQIADWIEKDLTTDESLMREFNWIMENKHEYETQLNTAA